MNFLWATSSFFVLHLNYLVLKLCMFSGSIHASLHLQYYNIYFRSTYIWVDLPVWFTIVAKHRLVLTHSFETEQRALIVQLNRVAHEAGRRYMKHLNGWKLLSFIQILRCIEQLRKWAFTLPSTKRVLFTYTRVFASESTLPQAISNRVFIPPRLLGLRIQYTRHVVIFNGIIYRDMSAMHKTRLKLPFKS